MISSQNPTATRCNSPCRSTPVHAERYAGFPGGLAGRTPPASPLGSGCGLPEPYVVAWGDVSEPPGGMAALICLFLLGAFPSLNVAAQAVLYLVGQGLSVLANRLRSLQEIGVKLRLNAFVWLRWTTHIVCTFFVDVIEYRVYLIATVDEPIKFGMQPYSNGER